MTKSRGIGRGGKRKGAGRPRGVPKKSLRIPIEVAETIQENDLELEKVIRRSRLIEFEGGEVYYLEDEEKYLVAVEDLQELGYRVTSQAGVEKVYKVYLSN